MKYLSTMQAAARLSKDGVRVSRQVIHDHIAGNSKPIIKAARYGRAYLITEAELSRFEAYQAGSKVFIRRRAKG